MIRALLAMLALAVATVPARAVLLGPGNGTDNTTDPGVGWAYVHPAGGNSFTYLGNGWVITAYHVAQGNAFPVTIDSVTYQPDPDPSKKHRLVSPTNQPVDLFMFKLQTWPDIEPVIIPTSSPAANAPVTLIGAGADRGSATTYLGIDGYFWAGSKTKRWGTNLVDGLQVVDSGYGPTHSFLMDWDQVGTTWEATGAAGDSGGGVFDAQGRLLGIIIALDSYSGQPANASFFGSSVAAADLSVFRNQIDSYGALPEPGTAGLLVAAGALLLRRRRP